MPVLTTKAVIWTVAGMFGFIISLAGSMMTALNWADTTYMPRTEVVSTLGAHVTQDAASLDRLRGENHWRFVQLRIHQIDESLARYHDKGISTLDDADRHRYQTLVRAATAIEAERNELLGITNN
ncbi:MAG: hypothetical protein DRQ48_01855 [Gammaproteobacteria bacterium]|nr:MAG: hypothetical protein DRQ48_01855 [Gammaproteobacteria bacterium]